MQRVSENKGGAPVDLAGLRRVIAETSARMGAEVCATRGIPANQFEAVTGTALAAAAVHLLVAAWGAKRTAEWLRLQADAIERDGRVLETPAGSA